MVNKDLASKLICVIIPVYNGEKHIQNCVEAIKKQTYSKFRMIAVDNASSDRSVEILKNNFPEVFLIKNSINGGFGKACNEGIKYAKKLQSWSVVLLNQDAIVEPNFLEAGQKILENNEIGLACPKITYGFTNKIWWVGGKIKRGAQLLTAPNFRVAEHIFKGASDRKQFNSPYETDYVTGCAVFIRTGTLNKVGLFDERFFMYSEDIDLSIRVKKAGFKLLFFPSTVVHHQVEKGSKKTIRSKLKKAKIYFVSTARLVLKNFSLFEKILWFLKLPFVLPLEFRNFKKME